MGLGRAPSLNTGGCGFESHQGHGLFQNHNLSLVYVFGVCIWCMYLPCHIAIHFTCIIITYLLCVRTASSDHTVYFKITTCLWCMYVFTLPYCHTFYMYNYYISPLNCVRTASSDHTARLWHVDRSDPIREYQGHTKAVTALAYNDSRY